MEEYYFRIPDVKKEPAGVTLDSDNTSLYPRFNRILEIIPVFNIILPFWSSTRLQLDTVFACLRKSNDVFQLIKGAENNDKTHINPRYINIDEEISIVAIKDMRELLDAYLHYQKETNLLLTDRDMSVIKDYMFEFVRKTDFPEKYSRLHSLMIYDNLGVAVQLAKEYDANARTRLCEMKIVEKHMLDRYDAGWYTSLSPTDVYADYVFAAKSYWAGEMSANCKMESLFSGKYILKEL